MRRLIPLLLVSACGDNIVPGGPGTGDASDPAVCLASNTVICDGDDLITCDASGVGTRSPCDFGCVVGTPSRCGFPTPTNLAPDTCATAGTGDLTIAAGENVVID